MNLAIRVKLWIPMLFYKDKSIIELEHEFAHYLDWGLGTVKHVTVYPRHELQDGTWIWQFELGYEYDLLHGIFFELGHKYAYSR